MVRLAGSLFNDAGAALASASVAVFPTSVSANESTGTGSATATTTTNSSGVWSSTGLAANSYDVRITSGSSIRWRRFADEIQLTRASFGDDAGIDLGADSDIVIFNRSTSLSADAEVTGVIEGISDHLGVTANSLIISNITDNGDIMFLVSDAGVSKGLLKLDGTNGRVVIHGGDLLMSGAQKIYFNDIGGEYMSSDGSTLTITGETALTPTVGSTAWGNANHAHAASNSGGTVTASSATVATTVTVTDNEDTNENNVLVFVAGADADGGNVGLESDGTLHYNPSTGLVTATGFSGNLTGTLQTASQTNITAVGTITTGTWEGTTVAVDQGGTGATSLSNLITLGTHTTGNYAATVANATNGGTTIANSGSESAAITVALNFNDLTDTAINVAADSIVFLDADGTASRRDTIADLATAMAGANITATNGVLAASGGAVVREGGQTSEATSTSTSSADMLTAGSLTVQVAEHYMYSGLARKTTGASATMDVGIKQNSTETRAAENSGNKRVFTTGAGNVADTGMYYGRFGPRIANYRRQGQGAYISYGSGTTQASGADACIGQDADSPLAEVTQVILSGITTSASITIALDELQIYSHAAS